jgi:hypothetical protein
VLAVGASAACNADERQNPENFFRNFFPELAQPIEARLAQALFFQVDKSKRAVNSLL